MANLARQFRFTPAERLLLVLAVVVAGGAGATAAVVFRYGADQVFNLLEGLLWTTVGLVLLGRAARAAPHRRLKIGAGVTFLLFALTDFIEIGTRAWFAPWPLLFLNAACLASLVVHLLLYWRSRRRLVAAPHEEFVRGR